MKILEQILTLMTTYRGKHSLHYVTTQTTILTTTTSRQKMMKTNLTRKLFKTSTMCSTNMHQNNQNKLKQIKTNKQHKKRKKKKLTEYLFLQFTKLILD